MSKLIIGSIGGEFVGITSEDVLEVVEIPRTYPVPFSLSLVRGVAFWRGALLTIVSLYSLLSPKIPEGQSRIFVRSSPPHDNILLALDKIEDVTPYNELKLRDEGAREIWKGLYPWNEDWVTVLSFDPLISLLEEEVIKTLRLGSNGR
jgi:chemotaxis signal transduction protein